MLIWKIVAAGDVSASAMTREQMPSQSNPSMLHAMVIVIYFTSMLVCRCAKVKIRGSFTSSVMNKVTPTWLDSEDIKIMNVYFKLNAWIPQTSQTLNHFGGDV